MNSVVTAPATELKRFHRDAQPWTQTEPLSDQEPQLAKHHLQRFIDQERKTLLAELVQSLPIGAIVLDNRGRVEAQNRIAEQLIGGDYLGEYWYRMVNKIFTPKENDGHDITLTTGYIVRLSTNSLPNGLGQFITLTDITETRNLQQSLNHQSRLEEMGKISASLAHQIRTPLSSAMLYAENLKKPSLDEPTRERFVNKLSQRLDQIEGQVRDILLYAKRSTLVNDQLDLVALLRDIAAMMNEQVVKQGGCIETHLPKQPVMVKGNKEALSGALINLIENAFDARADCQIQISTERVGQHIRLAIADNGPGIPQDIQQRVTEPFFTTKSTGTGLGLALVKHVVEAHQGRFKIQPNHPQGTLIEMELPL